MEFITPVRS